MGGPLGAALKLADTRRFSGFFLLYLRVLRACFSHQDDSTPSARCRTRRRCLDAAQHGRAHRGDAVARARGHADRGDAGEQQHRHRLAHLHRERQPSGPSSCGAERRQRATAGHRILQREPLPSHLMRRPQNLRHQRRLRRLPPLAKCYAEGHERIAWADAVYDCV